MNSLSLPKSRLLTKPWEYKQVYRHGKRLQGDHFSLIFFPNDKNTNRLGISIHGRLKGSVQRNRIKRVIKEFYRSHRTFLQNGFPKGDIPPALDIIFTVRKEFRLNSPREVETAVNSLLKTPGMTQSPEGYKISNPQISNSGRGPNPDGPC